MLMFTLLLMASLAGVLTVRTHVADVRSLDQYDDYTIVKDERFGELMKQQGALHQQLQMLSEQEPQKKEGMAYWLRDEEGAPFERCCCPFDPKTKLRKDGHGSFPKCQYLHAFQQGERNGPFWRLMHSRDPRRWDAWVCPGKLPYPHSLIGAHHSESPVDVAGCEKDKAEKLERQAEIQKEMQGLQEQIQALDEQLSTLKQQWGCKFSGMCESDTAACYECEKTGILFSRREGHEVLDGVAVHTTSRAARMDALEQCRVGCA